MKLISLVVTMIVITAIITIGGCAITIGVIGCTAKQINEKGLKNVVEQVWDGPTNRVVATNVVEEK